MNKIKHGLKSRTIQLALIQAFAGVLVAIFTEFDMIAYIAIVKSVADVYMRSITRMPLSER